MPGTVSRLHPQPDSRAIAEQLAKANGNLRRELLSLSQNNVQTLAGNIQAL